jgi:hypothetical protein
LSDVRLRTRRINRGRGHSYELDSQPVISVSGIKDMLPRPALNKWYAEQAAGYVLDNWDDLVTMKPSERFKAIVKSPYSTVRSAQIRGTTVHGYAEKLVAGGELEDVPEEMRGYAQAAASFQDDYEVEAELIEVRLFSRRYKYAGTTDLIAKALAKRGQPKRIRTLLDYKTSNSGIWPETALQLGLYAGADFYLDGDDNEVPMPEIDELWGVHLREDGTYSRHVVIADPAYLLKVGRYLQQVARWMDLDRSQIFAEADEG